ncbi:class I SAM-dependent methyltransferase [Candidatus Electrothrix sp.]|uniref:class I SAM-dependent methyltransferase n=1 Tax=Candidatus Electrothrix sp. TaxID=2170559 RepID=UPI004057507A
MKTLKAHWNNIFSNKADRELGWYEKDVSQTLWFLDEIPRNTSNVVFLPDAGTSLLVDELLSKGYQLILNDISDEALNALRERTGEKEGVSWLQHDISEPLPADIPQVDIWIDRAVLHFLLDEADIEGYFANLHTVVKPGGWVLLAEFSTLGAPKCAGLELHRYSVNEMSRRMGSEFELIRSEEYTFINPFGDPRPYIYALYKRLHG